MVSLKVGRLLIRAVLAYVLGTLATYALFFLVAWVVGDLAGGIHSNSAVLLLLQPVAWIGAFWYLQARNLPNFGGPESGKRT